MYNVYVLESEAFKTDLKVIVTDKQIDQKSLIKAHREVYDSDAEFIVHDNLKISDKVVFISYLKSLGHSCFVNSTLETIEEIVGGMYKIETILKKDKDIVSPVADISIEKECLISECPTMVLSNGTIDAYTDTAEYAVVHSTALNSRDIIDTKSILFCKRETHHLAANKCIGIENNMYYDMDLFQICFPELQISTLTNFPRHKLANEMLRFKIAKFLNNDGKLELQDVQDSVSQIKQFFGIEAVTKECGLSVGLAQADITTTAAPTLRSTDVAYEHPFNSASPFWNLSENPTDSTIKMQKAEYVVQFAREHCKKTEGCKVKSSELFVEFRDFCLKNQNMTDYEFDKLFNNTTFTLLMKEHTDFESKRFKDAIYWSDMSQKRK